MKYIARWLFIRLWSQEIASAHNYLRSKRLLAGRNSGPRHEYPMREAGAAMEVLIRLSLYEVEKPE